MFSTLKKPAQDRPRFSKPALPAISQMTAVPHQQPAPGQVPLVQQTHIPAEAFGNQTVAIPVEASVPQGHQQINVVTNNNSQLPLREWIFRGILSALGSFLAWPFRLVGQAVTTAVQAVLGIVKVAILILLIPTLIWLGLQLRDSLAEKESVEAGTAALVDHAESFATGVGNGVAN